MDEVGEAELFENREGAGAAAAGLAVDERGLGLVEFAELGFEVAGHDVDVLSAFDVAVFKLVWGPHINDSDFAVGDDLGGFVGFDVFDGICGEHEGREEKEEGGEERFHGMGDFQVRPSSGLRRACG